MMQPSPMLLMGLEGTIATLLLLGFGASGTTTFRTATLTGVKDSPASLTGVKDSPATLTGIKDSPATLTGE